MTDKKPHGLIGTKRPQETRDKIAASKRGVPRTEKAKASISAGKMGKKRNPEDGKKISEGLKRYWVAKSAGSEPKA